MKHSKIFRILAVAITLSLLVILLPAAPVLAAESLRVSPTKGAIGDEIDVSGSDYDPGDKVYIYFSSEEAEEGDDIDELDVWEQVKTTYAGDELEPDEGDIDTDFDVPDELTDGPDTEVVKGGDYFVYTTYTSEGRIQAVDEFTVFGITKVDPVEGTVGTEVEIEGVFEDEEDIEVFYDGDEIEIASGDDETDSKGKFELTIIIPESPAGDHTIKIEVKSDEGEVEFTVEPESDISATSGMIGDRVTITGTGFGASADVTVTFDGDEVATGETTNEGNLNITFEVPAVGAGTYDVEVEDEDGNKGDTFSFTMTTDIGVSPVTSAASPGHIGMSITISGTGFIPDHDITITYASTPVVFTTTSEDDGSFSYTFKIPKSEPGEHTITATDGTNSLEVAFFMEEAAPSIPQPLEPIMDAKPEQPVYFDWKDVTDPSGVTYTLQVATDKNFTAASLILIEEGLTKSEYTLEEELESTKKDAPYWWRVKAIDGVGNESGWTGAGSFNVGFVFEMPKWALYLLIGLGGVALFFIGFFVGRRTGYAY